MPKIADIKSALHKKLPRFAGPTLMLRKFNPGRAGFSAIGGAASGGTPAIIADIKSALHGTVAALAA
jgi:hypothetical protein